MIQDRGFMLDTKALAMAKASECLAVDERAFSRMLMLPESKPVVQVLPRSAQAGAGKGDGVAVVEILGPLMQRSMGFFCGIGDGYDHIVERFGEALNSTEAGAVLIKIDSPGGDAAGCFEAVRKMQRMRDEAGKPVYAYVDEQACSAAYALACVADAGIFGPASCEVGSVGVLCVHADQSRALENDGVKMTIVRSGARKAEANSLEPLSDAARTAMQARVDALAADFFVIVAASRELTTDAVAALQGAVVAGPEAVTAGLSDGVKSFDEVVSMAMEDASRTTRVGTHRRQKPGASQGMLARGFAKVMRLFRPGVTMEQADAALANALGAQVAATSTNTAHDLAGAFKAVSRDIALAAESQSTTADPQTTVVVQEVAQPAEASASKEKPMRTVAQIMDQLTAEEREAVRTELAAAEAAKADPYAGLSPQARDRIQKLEEDNRRLAQKERVGAAEAKLAKIGIIPGLDKKDALASLLDEGTSDEKIARAERMLTATAAVFAASEATKPFGRRGLPAPAGSAEAELSDRAIKLAAEKGVSIEVARGQILNSDKELLKRIGREARAAAN